MIRDAEEGSGVKKMIVMKFGGTSVRNAAWIDKVLDIVKDQLQNNPVLVASAMGKTTDKLQAIANAAEQGRAQDAHTQLVVLKEFHLQEINIFLSGKYKEQCVNRINNYFKSLESIVKGLCLLKEKTKRSNDAILAFGELFSTLVISCRSRERGIDTTLLDSRELIKTDNNYSRAAPNFKLTNRKIIQKIKPQPGKLFITQGFIGSTENGITTTLGRGGSDYTATIIGAALEAQEVQIWTDVNGIMTADPRVVPAASTIPFITYREAAELAYFGANVIHPSTIQPAINQQIPVVVKNTNNFQAAGTIIKAKALCDGVKTISYKKQITLINISSSRMLLAYGFLRRIFDIFGKYKTPVDLISTSEVSVSVTIDRNDYIKEIMKELSQIGNANSEDNKAIICLVGQELWKDSAFIARVFKSLCSIHIRMISLGSSDTNLSIVVPQTQCEEAVSLLHKEFFE